LEGIESDAGPSLLYSTVHGAGRLMSRTQAAGKSKRRKIWTCKNRDCDYRAPFEQLPGGERQPCPEHPHAGLGKVWLTEQIRPGVVDWPATRELLRINRIELRGGAADEAPLAYKRLDEVLSAHADTITVKHRLTPIGVAMAGPDVFDPFKD
jgi:tRNA-splicing ligase RtcB (3'-phosphate/5'-hydroxy nucleic acid ligase)